MEDLVSQTAGYIKANSLAPPGCIVVAAVSGGADSLAMLLILHKLCPDLGFNLVAAHVDHGLRGAESAADLSFVRSWCADLKVPFYEKYVDVAAWSRREAVGLESAGRQARLAFFAELARLLEQPAAAGRPPRLVRIALAHHRDDQAETILLHLGRGCGLDGLTGMKAGGDLLIRPLLERSRAEIEQWLAAQQIEWRRDASNDTDFTLRNRLRLQVLPAWKQALGYDPAPLLCRTAALLAEDRILLGRLADSAFAACRRGAALAAADLLALDPALQSRVLRLFWQAGAESCSNLAAIHVQLIRDWLPAAVSGQSLNLPDNRQISLRSGQLWLETSPGGRGEPEIGPAGSLADNFPLNLPGETFFPALNLQLTVFFIENESQIVYNNAMECFRLDRIAGAVLRTRRPGDRIRPLGRQGSRNLKKFLNERHIPPDRRDRLPLIALGQEIVWLPGYAAGSRFVARAGDGGCGRLVCLLLRDAGGAETVTEDLSDRHEIV